MRVHYIQHVDGEDIGNMRPWFEKHNIKPTSTQLHRQETLPDIADFDWLIVLGGPMGVYEEANYPWLKPEKRLIAQAISANKVVLGICLGGQLIANALGAEVAPHQVAEIGWFTIDKIHHTQATEWLPNKGRFLHWHGDTFQIPTGATLFAKSEATPHQGFLYSDRVIALQFHLEAHTNTPTIFEQASLSAIPSGPYIQEAELRQGTDVDFVQSQSTMEKLLDYLALIGND